MHPIGDNPAITRRVFVWSFLGALVALRRSTNADAQPSSDQSQHRRWIDAAFELKRRAESSGDQAYGAVVVLDGKLIGEGPSRVVLLGDANGHAEREAIRDAQQRLGRKDLSGAVLYSTSRPCSRCEFAAAEANIGRMIHGTDLRDAGKPQR